VPSAPDAEPLTIAAADATRRIVDEMEGTKRLMLHGRVNPNQPGDLERMDELAAQWDICAWKTYTQFGPGGHGYFLSDEPGLAMIEKARALGIKVCVHKGCRSGAVVRTQPVSDIGKVAKQYPTALSFITRLRCGQSGARIRPCGRATVSTHCAVARQRHRAEQHRRNSARRFLTRAGPPRTRWHVQVRERTTCCGNRPIWYGSPQDQIQAFRAFQIAPAARGNGYPELTPALGQSVRLQRNGAVQDLAGRSETAPQH
jgi:hypothetical protein